MSSPTNVCHRNLAADVIIASFAAALDGDANAELWLRESRRARIFAAGLGFDHDCLIAIFDEYKAAGIKPTFTVTIGKRGRGRPKKVTSV